VLASMPVKFFHLYTLFLLLLDQILAKRNLVEMDIIPKPNNTQLKYIGIGK